MKTVTTSLPVRFDLHKSLDFLCTTVGIKMIPGQDMTFDFSQVSWVEPFGMLLLASRIRKLVSDCSKHDVPCYSEGHANMQDSINYLSYMGFFQSIGLDHGNEPGQVSANQRYIPITEIRKDILIREPSALFDEHIGESVERRSRQLARVLAQDETDLRDTLNYCIREIIRNGFEHSNSNTVWIAGQCWPKMDKVEIAILDEGIGVMKSLSQNPNLDIGTEEDALRWAIQPGISGKAHHVSLRQAHGYDNVWENSGYGLFITSKLCQMAGDFVIISGKKALQTSPSGIQVHTTHFSGTAIRICLTISKLPKLQQALTRIVAEGESKAQSLGAGSIMKASKSSGSV